MEKYSAVHFCEENSVEAVPITWISADKKFCKWPNAKDKRSLKSLKKKSCAPGQDWPSYQVRVLGSYGDYDTARDKCKLAEVTSDLEGGQRNRQGTSQQTVLQEQEPPHAPPYEINYIEPAVDGTATNGLPITIIQDSAVVTELASAFAEFQKVSLENQELLKAEVKELKQLLLNALAQSANIPTAQPNLPLLPVCELSELNLLEEWLTSQDNHASMVKLLSRIGGSDSPKVVYNILAHVFSHDLSKTLRLTKKSGKIAVGDFKITRAVIEAAQSTH